MTGGIGMWPEQQSIGDLVHSSGPLVVLQPDGHAGAGKRQHPACQVWLSAKHQRLDKGCVHGATEVNNRQQLSGTAGCMQLQQHASQGHMLEQAQQLLQLLLTQQQQLVLGGSHSPAAWDDLVWTPEQLNALLGRCISAGEQEKASYAALPAVPSGHNQRLQHQVKQQPLLQCQQQQQQQQQSCNTELQWVPNKHISATGRLAVQLQKQLLPLFHSQTAAIEQQSAVWSQPNPVIATALDRQSAGNNHTSAQALQWPPSPPVGYASNGEASGTCFKVPIGQAQQRQQQNRREMQQNAQQRQQHQPLPLKHIQQQQQCIDQLPAKGAQPGDYKKIEVCRQWDAAALQAAAAAGATELQLPLHATTQLLAHSQHWQGALPASAATAEFGVLLLAHEKGVPTAAAWDAWEAAHAGRVVVLVHLKAGVSVQRLQDNPWASSRLLDTRIASNWGEVSLTEAKLAGAAEMLQRCPQLQHIAIASGQDVPVAALKLPLPSASMFGTFQFGRQYDAAARQVAAAQLQQHLGMTAAEAAAWGAALTFHATWMVLDRHLLLALWSKRQQVLEVGHVLHQRFMQPDAAVAADEFLPITAAIRYGFVKKIVRSQISTYLAGMQRQQKQQHKQLGSWQQWGQQPQTSSATLSCKAADHSCGPTEQRDSACTSSTNSGMSEGMAVTNWLCTENTSKSQQTQQPQVQPQPLKPNSSKQQAANSCSTSRSAGMSCCIARSYADAAEVCSRQPVRSKKGVLLDCCPTLALFHPTHTRHPHIWRNFSEVLLCDIRTAEGQDNKLNLLDALALAKPNGALFFRKVDVSRRMALAKLLCLLNLLWRGQELPASLAEVDTLLMC